MPYLQNLKQERTDIETHVRQSSIHCSIKGSLPWLILGIKVVRDTNYLPVLDSILSSILY